MSLIEGEQNTQSLVEAAKRGDARAFEKLYRFFFTPVYRYIYLRVKDKKDVEILTQDVFIKIYNSFSHFESKTNSPLSFFFTVARNTIIDHWRKNRNQVSFGKEDVMMQIPDSAPIADELYEKKELTTLLYKGLNKIGQNERDAITMKYLNDISNREIARFMGKSEESVRQLQSRGMKSLRKVLHEMSQEPIVRQAEEEKKEEKAEEKIEEKTK